MANEEKTNPLSIPVVASTIVSYLPAYEMCMTVVGGTRAMRDACMNMEGEDLWRAHMSSDFGVKRDPSISRSPGYYRKLYLDILEERVIEDNLVCGGH
jgi:hypothetical protein